MSRYAPAWATSSTRRVAHLVGWWLGFEGDVHRTKRTVCGLPVRAAWQLLDERPEDLRLCASCEARERP